MQDIAATSRSNAIKPFAVFPAGPTSVDAALGIAGERSQELWAQLLKAGALLFRGFDLRSLADFDRLVGALTDGGRRFGYQGGASPRAALGQVGARIYSSTEYPPDIELALHNELSYADLHPRHLFFFCLTAPDHGGATTLADSRRILAGIDPAVRDAFRGKGVRYVRNLSPDRNSPYSWQSAFETEQPAEAEATCRAMGAAFRWEDNGFLRVWQRRPATAIHPVSGEEVWFNQADGFHPSALDRETYDALIAYHGGEDGFRLGVSFGDGEPIDRAMLDEVRRAIAAERTEHHWQQGDVVVLDNYLAAHGRAAFTGPRTIALAMT